MYVIPTTVMAESPTPVRSRVAKSPVGFQAKAFRSENPEYQTVEKIRAFFRPSRSENQPPVIAPTNMPKKVAEVITPIMEIDKCQAIRMAGAAYEKVLMSPSSKKNMMPSSHIICR